MRALFALLMLAACVPAPRPQASPALTAIEFRINSWGKPVSAGRIAPDGAGTYTYAEGPGFGTHLITRRFSAGPQGFAQVRALLAPAERAAAAPPDCGERWTDFPYGSVSWLGATAKTSIPFDLGCKNPALKPIHDALGKLNKQMESWSKTGDIIENKEMDQ